MLEGISYYQNLLPKTSYFESITKELEMQLHAFQQELNFIEVK